MRAPRPAVGAYIFETSSHRWEWFVHDCCRFVDGWIVACGHPSAMAAIGMRYDSELSALRRIMEGGGLVELWSRGMEVAGVPLVDEADMLAAGDVGVIERPTVCGVDQAMALYTGERWASLGLRGVECGPADALRVWRP